jgi:hypothetical protein
VPELVGDLHEGLVEQRDVVCGGVRSGVARAQHAGQRFVGVIAEQQQRVIAERVPVD